MNARVSNKLLIEKEYREEHNKSTMVLRAIWEEFSDRLWNRWSSTSALTEFRFRRLGSLLAANNRRLRIEDGTRTASVARIVVVSKHLNVLTDAPVRYRKATALIALRQNRDIVTSNIIKRSLILVARNAGSLKSRVAFVR